MRFETRTVKHPTVCVLGGTGFVGRHLVNRLADSGYQIRVITRHRERHRELLVRPEVQLIDGNINDLDVLRQHFKDCDAVINLAAILNEKRRGDFQNIHVVLPGKIIQACRDRGISRLIHMSALNAAATDRVSRYLHSKGQGEKLVQVASKDLNITVFRPSIIFGPDDHFFNHFAQLLHLSPGVFPLVCPMARFAPIYVGDVVDAFIAALQHQQTIGKTYDLCGPQVYTMEELVKFTASTLGLCRLFVRLGRLLTIVQARVLERLPGKIFTYDNYLSMQQDNVCQGPPAAELGLQLHSIESIVPGYLKQQNIRGLYAGFRRSAGRNETDHGP